MLKNGRQMHSEVDFWIVSLLSPPPPPPSGPQSAFLGFNFLKPSQTIYKAKLVSLLVSILKAGLATPRLAISVN